MSNIPIGKKSLGQHWLYDKPSLEAMANEAQVVAGDTVLEVGPGTGSLTEVILDRGAHVTAVELDHLLIKQLNKKFGHRSFKLHQQSILEFDLTTQPAGYKLVANIPYYLTNNLIRVLSESSNPPELAVILIQKEVAERVTAAPGKMSLLSVTAQFYWMAHLGRLVPAHLFLPPPKINSQILVLKHRKLPMFENMDHKKFFRLVKAGFNNRRKTLSNSLSAGLRLDKTNLKILFETADIDPKMRPQELSLEQWHRLYVQAVTLQLI